jgi:hypothetical protein
MARPSELGEGGKRALARVVAELARLPYDPIDHRHSQSISNAAWTTRSSAVHLG